MIVIAAEVENQRLVEAKAVLLCAPRWCLREVSDSFISGILPIAPITRVRTPRGQVLELVRVLSVRGVHVLVLGVHIGGTYSEIAEVSRN